MSKTEIIEVDVLREMEKTFFKNLDSFDNVKTVSLDDAKLIYIESRIEVLRGRLNNGEVEN